MASKIEIGLMILMGLGFICVFINRCQLKRGIVGRRVTQFLVVLLVAPLATILVLEGKPGSDAIASLFGTILGYVLSPLAKENEDSN